MKKIILIVFLTVFIPYLVVTLFIKNDEIKFYYSSNMVVRVKRESKGVIEQLPLEEYIVGVLAGEMPISFDIEALKAQSVAARTYVMKKMYDNKTKDYDIVDTVQNQVYLNNEELREKWKIDYENKINKIKKVVAETSGEYLTYKDEIIEAFFFSTSVGKTENSEDVFSQKLPYLRSVDSTWDSEVSPVFNDTYSVTLDEFCSKLELPYSDSINANTISTTSTGRIKKISINNHEYSGSDVYRVFKLRSTFFDIEQDGNTININTKGYGHGVGMSQYGALAMAKKGYHYDEILKYYYQGVEIKKI